MKKLEPKVMRKAGRYMMRAALYNFAGSTLGYRVRVKPDIGVHELTVVRRRGFDRHDDSTPQEHWGQAEITWPTVHAHAIETAKAFGALLMFLADLGKRLNDCGREAEWEAAYLKQMQHFMSATDRRGRAK